MPSELQGPWRRRAPFALANHVHHDLMMQVKEVVAESEVSSSVATGVGQVPALLIGGSATFSVTLNRTMPAGYAATAFVGDQGNGLLGNIAITAYAVADSTHVSVTVKNNGLLTLSGATVVVLAVAAAITA